MLHVPAFTLLQKESQTTIHIPVLKMYMMYCYNFFVMLVLDFPFSFSVFKITNFCSLLNDMPAHFDLTVCCSLVYLWLGRIFLLEQRIMAINYLQVLLQHLGHCVMQLMKKFLCHIRGIPSMLIYCGSLHLLPFV